MTGGSEAALKSPQATGVSSARVWMAVSGLAGLLALAAYYVSPYLANWPNGGGSASVIAAYGLSHEALFFGAAWLQATGTVLIVTFFLGLVAAAGAVTRLSGLVVILASISLLSLVLVEALLAVFVPIAAGSGDHEAAAVAFGLVNGTFARVFPLGPASWSYLGLGWVVLQSGVIDRRLGYAALGLGAAFEVAGLIAIASPAGAVLATTLSVLQVLWVAAAAIVYAATPRRAGVAVSVAGEARSSLEP